MYLEKNLNKQIRSGKSKFTDRIEKEKEKERGDA
jgi:hypothetical protein